MAEIPQGTSGEEERKKPGFGEALGIWAANRLLQYLNTLGPNEQVSDLRPIFNTKRRRTSFRWKPFVRNYASVGALILAAVGLLLSIPDQNSNRLPTKGVTPAVTTGVDPEQTDPYLLIQTLNGKGSHATFAYGGIVNDIEGLAFQVDPVGLNKLVDSAGLILPPGKTIVTILTEGDKPATSVMGEILSQYEKEQGKLTYEMSTGFLSFSEITKAVPKSTVDLPNAQFTLAWLRDFKRRKEFLETGVINDSSLTPEQMLAIGRLPILPFRILRVPN